MNLDWERLAKAGMGRPDFSPLQTFDQHGHDITISAPAKEAAFAASWRDHAVRFLLGKRPSEFGTAALALMADHKEFWVEHNDLGLSSEELSLDSALWSAVSAVLTAKGKL